MSGGMEAMQAEQLETYLAKQELAEDFATAEHEIVFIQDTETHSEITSPAHYTSGEIECIDAIQAALTHEEFRGFCKGNILKYTWRERLKQGDDSMRKAKWYLNRLLGIE